MNSWCFTLLVSYAHGLVEQFVLFNNVQVKRPHLLCFHLQLYCYFKILTCFRGNHWVFCLRAIIIDHDDDRPTMTGPRKFQIFIHLNISESSWCTAGSMKKFKR